MSLKNKKKNLFVHIFANKILVKNNLDTKNELFRVKGKKENYANFRDFHNILAYML